MFKLFVAMRKGCYIERWGMYVRCRQPGAAAAWVRPAKVRTRIVEAMVELMILLNGTVNQ